VSSDLKERAMVYAHHGNPLVPRQQRYRCPAGTRIRSPSSGAPNSTPTILVNLQIERFDDRPP
jgi:hypothetical protein